MDNQVFALSVVVPEYFSQLQWDSIFVHLSVNVGFSRGANRTLVCQVSGKSERSCRDAIAAIQAMVMVDAMLCYRLSRIGIVNM